MTDTQLIHILDLDTIRPDFLASVITAEDPVADQLLKEMGIAYDVFLKAKAKLCEHLKGTP
jgi:hypothetical protein